MPGGDGSVVIPIEMPVDDAEKELSKLKKTIDGLEKDLSKSQGKEADFSSKYEEAAYALEEQQAKAAVAKAKMEELADSEKAALENITEYKTELAQVSSRMAELESHGVFGHTSSAADKEWQQLAAQKREIEAAIGEEESGLELLAPKLQEANAELQKQEEITEKTREKAEQLKQAWESQQAAVSVIADELDRQKSTAGELIQGIEEAAAAEAARLQEIADSAVVSDQHILDLNDELAQLKERMADLQAAGVGLGYEEYDQIEARISEINSEIKDYRKNLNDSSDDAENAGKGVEEIAKSTKSAGGFMDQFATKVKNLMAGAFVFQIISAAFKKLREWISKVVQTNAEASQAMAQLKGALLTLAQPIVEIIIPAFIKLMNILTIVVSKIASFVSGIFGKTASQSAEAAKGLYEQTEALEGVGGAAEDAAGSLAGFDEINTISSDSGGGGGGAGGGNAPDFSGMINGGVDAISGLIVGAALLAIGAILTFSGISIPVGIAMMAMGALTIIGVAVENWGAISQALQGPLGDVVALISVALLAIGAILAFSGINLFLGIALMAAGAIGLAAYAAANWDTVSAALEGPVGIVVALISGAALMLGAVMAFSGVNLPLGIALMVIGAAGLATVMAVNWDSIKAKLQGPVGAVVALVSTALLALGAILAFSGVALPLGIALMVAGAVGLVTTIVANWNAIQNALGGPVAAVVAIISAALLVLGAILLFTGAGIPLGLGLLVAGGIGLAAAVAPNWNFIKDKIKEVWDSVKTWWRDNVEKFLSWEYWKELGLNMVNGIIEGLMSIFSQLISWASSVWNTISGLFGGLFGGGASATANVSGTSTYSIDTGALPSIPIASIPKLASGGVIPPNREFMAVLGDQTSGNNIEAPESLIRKIVREESGGANTALLQDILEAIREGQVMVVDKKVLARVTAQGINDLTRASGKPVLLY